MDKFWEFLHEGQIIRRLILAWALVMTTWFSIEVSVWAMTYEPITATVSAIVAAILTPVLGLTGWIIKNYAQHPYAEGKSKKKDDNGGKE